MQVRAEGEIRMYPSNHITILVMWFILAEKILAKVHGINKDDFSQQICTTTH